MQKKGLGINPLDNIIPSTNEGVEKPKTIKNLKNKTLKVLNIENDEKLLVSIRPDQREFLERLANRIMRERTSEYKEKRITKNSILRVAIDIIKKAEDKINTKNIPNEAVLAERLKTIFENPGN